jgi:AcrR family transcriptional regulator
MPVVKRKIRRNAERTQQRLLQAAIRLFAEHGYHGVAVDQIVLAARVNKRMVYHYFGSKGRLFMEAFKEVYNRLGTVEFHAVERGRSPREKLTRLLESYFQFLDEDPVYTRFLLWINLERGKLLEKDRHLFTKETFFRQFQAIVDEGIQSGEFRSDLNVQQLLIHFIGLCFIYHSNQFSLSQGLQLNLGDARIKAEGLNQVIKLVFEGITPRRPAGAETIAPAGNGDEGAPASAPI